MNKRKTALFKELSTQQELRETELPNKITLLFSKKKPATTDDTPKAARTNGMSFHHLSPKDYRKVMQKNL
ncbi:MAG: hypothetical protein LBR86_02340 [Tannerella sp.]|jgi:hypothetical protein|nr:hypothetical protein [Tannerella sp.]